MCFLWNKFTVFFVIWRNDKQLLETCKLLINDIFEYFVEKQSKFLRVKLFNFVLFNIPHPSSVP